MNKFNHILKLSKNNSKIFSRLLLTTLLITSSSLLFSQKAIAFESKLITQNNSQTTDENEQKNQSNVVSKSRNQSSILESLWKLLKVKREQEPALSSRSNICEVTPGLLGDVNVIYSDRPLFLWQGNVANVKINLYTPFSLEQEQQILWSQTIENQSDKVFYTGKALKAGKIYDWELVVKPQSNQRRISFQIMNTQKRDRISLELEQLKTELTTVGATNEQITLAKANYFAQQDLWSDVIQELFTVENPSPTLSNNIQEIIKYLCAS